jgi:Tol biopolymer transport system component
MSKRIFAISTLVLVLLVAMIFVYNFAFKKQAPRTTPVKTSAEGKATNSTPETDSSTSKQSNDGMISAVSDDSVFGATLAPDGNTLYCFSGENGQLDQIDFNGKLEKVISTEEFQGIQKVIWNKQKTMALIKRANGPTKSKFLVLNLASKKVAALKDSIDSAAWSNLGDKIIYKFFDPATKKRTLNTSDPDGGNWRKLADVDFFSAEIAPVPGSSNISFWPSPDAFTATSVALVTFNGEDRKEILKNRFGTDLLWSPDGKYAAVSSTDQKGGKKTDLAIMNPDGGQFQALNFPTFMKKCAWSSDSKSLFCAIPGNIPESAILPNDWQEGRVHAADTFWKIEVATGKKERLIETDKIGGAYDALNPFLSKDEKDLFFTNRADGKLYKLAL